MTTTWKKAILYLTITCFILVVLLARESGTSIETIEDINAANKATCLNGYNSLTAAQFQKDMLDQQVLLSAAKGDGEEAAAWGVHVSELKTIIAVLEELVNDPALNCTRYKETT